MLGNGFGLEQELQQEYTIADLRMRVPLSDAIAIDQYQVSHLDTPRDLISSPLPPDFLLKNEQASRILVNNRSRYDSDIEARIKQDRVIAVIEQARRKGHNASDIVHTKRARRSVIALLYEHDQR